MEKLNRGEGHGVEIKELRCKACNGILKLDDNNPNIAVCEYCETTYIIYKDEPKSTYLKEESLSGSGRWYIPVEEKKETKWWEYYNWKRMIITSIVVFIIYVAIRWEALVNRYQQENDVVVTKVNQEKINVDNLEQVGDTPLNGIVGDMITSALQKPIDEIKAEDLSCFKWIKIKYTQEEILIGYSFEMPEDCKEDVLKWLHFPRDTTGQKFKDLSRFTGLKKLEITGYLPLQAVKGLHLESLTCYASSPIEIAMMVDTTTLKELNILGGIKNLEGISKFENLERLSFTCNEIKDIKELVHQKNLKALTIENGDEINDFTVIALMSRLEELAIESEKLRDINFLKSLTKLKTLSISDAPILQLNALETLGELTELSIKSCDELKDLSVLEGLTALKRLVLEVPYNCEEPDLSALRGLNTLSIAGVKNTAFLSNMKALEELNLERCSIDDSEVFKHLIKLRTLKCSSISGELSNWSFVTKIPSLENLDLSGISTYEDISCVFEINSLQKLLLNGAECEIDFSNIKENPSLKILKMNGIKLYKNVQVRGQNGFYTINYDRVNLDENIDFIKKFKGLTDLSLADNMLTHINFAKELYSLEVLDISQNYITDLKPLEEIGNLEKVNCTDNPIENYRILGDKVVVIH